MMRFILFFLFLGCASLIYAQSDYDKRILAKFSQAQLEKLQTTKPSTIAFWTYFLNHGYGIVDISPEKNYEFLGTIKLPDDSTQNLNLFEMNLPHPLEKSAFYRIEGSEQMLVLYSRESLVRSFNKRNTSPRL